MPAPAPLDSCLRRNDALGAGAHGRSAGPSDSWEDPTCWGRAPFVCPQDRLRQAQGERSRELVLRCVGVARSSSFLPSQERREGCGRGLSDRDSPASRRRRWIPAFAGRDGGVCGNDEEGETAPCLAPALGSRFRENDAVGGAGRVGGGGAPPCCPSGFLPPQE